MYFPGLWKEQLVNGVNYQFPWYQGINVDLVNTKIFTDVANFPKTVDQLPEFCKMIKAKTGRCAIFA
jgi:ABC-type glycerol-3-phosphate transport system substrate-binding protein